LRSRTRELGAAETALLQELVRAGAEGGGSEPGTGHRSIDWACFLDASERHHLTPLVFEGMRSRSESLPAAPEEIRERIENARNLELAKSVVRLHHVDELGAAALRAGMDLYLLKGAALATALYRDPGLRPMSDVDVLVEPSQFDLWSRELETLGYVTVDASDHATCFRRRTTGVLVELHRQLTSGAEFLGVETGAILERSRPIDAASAPRLRTLSWEDHLVHLCLHASFQHGFRQPGVNAWDARSLAERPDFDPEEFVERARRKRLAPWVYGGLAMTAAVFGTPRILSLLSHLRDSVPRSVVRKALRFRAERLLSPAREAVFGLPTARLAWAGWNLTTPLLLREISRPRTTGIHRDPRTRLGRIVELIHRQGIAMFSSTSDAAPALSMGPTSASLGEVRDV
jgi:hypothetical protein